MAINQRKAAVIGCGFVGASIAFSLMQRGLFSELVLIDANHRKAEGEAMDLSHGLPYAASMEYLRRHVCGRCGLRPRHRDGGREPEAGRDAARSDRPQRLHSRLHPAAAHGFRV